MIKTLLASNSNLVMIMMALVGFCVLFGGIVFATFGRSAKKRHDRLSHLPLEGDA